MKTIDEIIKDERHVALLTHIENQTGFDNELFDYAYYGENLDRVLFKAHCDRPIIAFEFEACDLDDAWAQFERWNDAT